MKIVAKKDRKLLLINTGNTQNENKAETIELTVPEEYEDYNKKIVFVTDDGIVWDIIQDNTYKLTKAITKYKQVDFYIWLTKGDVDFRSKTMPLRFYNNEDASDEITPEEIHGVNTVVNLLEEEIEKVDSLETELRALITDIQNKLDNGEFDGEDGYTPQKGVDYFTEQDIEEIEGDILNEVYTKEQTDTLLDEKADIEDIPDVSSFITKDVNDLTNYTLKTNTGSLIDLEINDTTYVVTLKLKNQDGTIISTDTIDLPLESVVVSGRYDNTTKKVILTLENGSKVDFSVADLVAGLQTEITSQNKLASDLVDDTNSGNKFVTTSEKQTWNNKLDESDLTDYVKNTDYATSSKGGVIKANSFYATYCGSDGFIQATQKNYSEYLSSHNALFIGKGTLENVIAGKQLINQTQLEESQETQDEEIEKLQTENERLKATLPTTGEVTGQDVTLNKTAEMEFVKPPLPKGNTKQDTTTGKNLLNTINANTTTVNGVTSYRSNGFYYLSGTNTKTDATWVLPNTQNTNLPTFEIGQTYTMSFKGTLPSGIYAQLNGVKTSTGKQYNLGTVTNTATSVTFTIDSDYSSTAQLFVGIQGATTNADCNFAIQIEKGSTATSYEPYTNGPSPNPDYPQEISNVTGDVEVVVENKNLFDASERTFNSTYNGDFVLIKDRNSKWYGYIDISKVKFPLTISTFIYNSTSNISDTNLRISLKDKNKKDILFRAGTSVTSSNKKSVVTILQSDITDEMKYLSIGIRVQDGGYTENTQIEQNSTSTNFVEHKEQKFIFPLSNEKLMLGDYLADDGIHHVRGQYIFTGSETWNFYSVSAAKFGIILPNVKNEGQSINPSFLCTQYRSLSWDALGNNSPNNLISITSANMIRFRNNSIDTLENWTQYITEQYNNGTPVIIEYPLNEEQIVPYTSAQQEVYNQIKQALSYEEQTNISSNQNALFSVEAYQNTKLVLQDISNAIVALGGV